MNSCILFFSPEKSCDLVDVNFNTHFAHGLHHHDHFFFGRFLGSPVIGPIVRSSVWLRRWGTAGGPALYFVVMQNTHGLRTKTTCKSWPRLMWFNIFMYSKQGTVLVLPAGNPKDADTADENLNGASFSDLWPSNRFV